MACSIPMLGWLHESKGKEGWLRPVVFSFSYHRCNSIASWGRQNEPHEGKSFPESFFQVFMAKFADDSIPSELQNTRKSQSKITIIVIPRPISLFFSTH